MPQGFFRRRQLPHWDVDDAPYFVTACLAGSVNAAGLSKIRSKRDELQQRKCPAGLTSEQWEHRKSKLMFKFVDDLLDHQVGSTHLANPDQAEIVQNAFLHFAGERYDLLAFVVMPSHHHWLFLPRPEWVERVLVPQTSSRTPKEAISHSIQSYTATMCNRARGQNGAYWQTETYDHWARDEEEVFRIIDYIEKNPVKARLVDEAENWRYSSARIRKELGIEIGEAIPKQ